MEIIFSIKENILIAELLGELDHHAAEKVRCDIDETMETFCATNLIFDFTKVTFMDSSGIGVILGRYRKLKTEGGKIAIVGCMQTVRNILNMAGIFSIIDYLDTKEEAIEFFSRKEVS